MRRRLLKFRFEVIENDLTYEYTVQANTKTRNSTSLANVTQSRNITQCNEAQGFFLLTFVTIQPQWYYAYQ